MVRRVPTEREYRSDGADSHQEGSSVDMNGVLSAAYDQPNSRLKTTTVAGTPEAAANGVKHDINWVLSQVWDGTGIRVINVG